MNKNEKEIQLEQRPKKIVSLSPIFSDFLSESRVLEENQGELYQIFLYSGSETAILTLYDSAGLASQCDNTNLIVRLRCSVAHLMADVSLDPPETFHSLVAILEGEGAAFICRRKILREGRTERDREERQEFYGEKGG